MLTINPIRWNIEWLSSYESYYKRANDNSHDYFIGVWTLWLIVEKFEKIGTTHLKCGYIKLSKCNIVCTSTWRGTGATSLCQIAVASSIHVSMNFQWLSGTNCVFLEPLSYQKSWARIRPLRASGCLSFCCCWRNIQSKRTYPNTHFQNVICFSPYKYHPISIIISFIINFSSTNWNIRLQFHFNWDFILYLLATTVQCWFLLFLL